MEPKRRHKWIKRPGDKWTWCLTCGVVQRRDKKNKPCKGPVRLRPFEQISPLHASLKDKKG